MDSSEDAASTSLESDTNSESSIDNIDNLGDVSDTDSLNSADDSPRNIPQPAPRRPPLPGLSLPIPRLAIPPTNVPPNSAPTPRSGPKPPPIPIQKIYLQTNNQPQSSQLTIELLSPAFSITSLQDSRKGLDMQTQCASKLGIRHDRVKVYALVEVNSLNSIPDDCNRLAVEVKGSAFSLHAIEEILAENQRLTQDIASLKARSTTNTDTDIAQVEKLQQEIMALRQRLSNSEMLRYKGQQALQELKEEFETLHFDLLSMPSPESSSLLSPR